VSNESLTGFRVILAEAPAPTHEFFLTPEQAQALNVQEGEHVRVVALSPKEKA
jgi:arginine N-succinyltransferase